MENYGLVIYLEKYLLNNNKSPQSNQQYTYRIISHEIAHMWYYEFLLSYYFIFII
jgi:aminopeptidase N